MLDMIAVDMKDKFQTDNNIWSAFILIFGQKRKRMEIEELYFSHSGKLSQLPFSSRLETDYS